jgi:glycosyltransferase involved in cell wall biosynthesis
MLRRTLSWLSHTRSITPEVIVVDDASTDDTSQVAEGMGARVIRLPVNLGPAGARNAGAAVANGEYLVFLDGDVGVKPDTLTRIVQTFTDHPNAAAVFGSYDLTPGSPNVLSQYRNLLHHFVHQTSNERASTFWAGCGAIKASVFHKMGGFDTSFARPSVEDIDLGMRMHHAGYQIVLNKAIQVTHFKHWALWSILKTDVWDRGVPWTRLTLATTRMPDDLNLRISQRVSVVLTAALLASFAVGVWFQPWLLLLPCVLCAALLGIDYCSQRWRIPTGVRGFGVLAGTATAAVLTAFFEYWVLLPLALVSAIVVLNRRLYLFFARERYLLFAAFVLPMHLLYFTYCGFAFVVGIWLHVRRVPLHGARQVRYART